MIDWSSLILAILKKRGWTQVQLAARIGVASTTLNWWIKNGADIKYSHGAALLKLYSEEEK